MTLPAHVRYAPPLSTYPALPWRGEPGIEPAVVVVRAERCACRGTVVQLEGEEPDQAVARHNAGRRHASWRTRREQGLDGGPTAGSGARDVSARRPARPAPVQRWRRG